MKTCNECNGTKLKKESLNVFLTLKQGAGSKLKGAEKPETCNLQPGTKYNIADLQRMPLNDLIAFVDAYKEHTTKAQNLVQRIINPLNDRAKTIQDLGLGYLSLNR